MRGKEKPGVEAWLSASAARQASSKQRRSDPEDTSARMRSTRISASARNQAGRRGALRARVSGRRMSIVPAGLRARAMPDPSTRRTKHSGSTLPLGPSGRPRSAFLVGQTASSEAGR
jgi:hypothetical protein